MTGISGRLGEAQLKETVLSRIPHLAVGFGLGFCPMSRMAHYVAGEASKLRREHSSPLLCVLPCPGYPVSADLLFPFIHSMKKARVIQAQCDLFSLSLPEHTAPKEQPTGRLAPTELVSEPAHTGPPLVLCDMKLVLSGGLMLT